MCPVSKLFAKFKTSSMVAATNVFIYLPSTTNGRIRWPFYNQIFETASKCETATATRNLYTRNDQWFEMIDAQFGNTLKTMCKCLNMNGYYLDGPSTSPTACSIYLWLTLETCLQTSGESSHSHLDSICCKLLTIRLQK